MVVVFVCEAHRTGNKSRAQNKLAHKLCRDSWISQKLVHRRYSWYRKEYNSVKLIGTKTPHEGGLTNVRRSTCLSIPREHQDGGVLLCNDVVRPYFPLRPANFSSDDTSPAPVGLQRGKESRKEATAVVGIARMRPQHLSAWIAASLTRGTGRSSLHSLPSIHRDK